MFNRKLKKKNEKLEKLNEEKKEAIEKNLNMRLH